MHSVHFNGISMAKLARNWLFFWFFLILKFNFPQSSNSQDFFRRGLNKESRFCTRWFNTHIMFSSFLRNFDVPNSPNFCLCQSTNFKLWFVSNWKSWSFDKIPGNVLGWDFQYLLSQVTLPENPTHVSKITDWTTSIKVSGDNFTCV